MNGFYFVLTIYQGGRVGYSEKQYKTERGASRRAALQRNKAGVRTAKVCYQTGETVDIKKFI